MIIVVGLGPGDALHRTHRATQALESADVIVGYKLYVSLIRDEFPNTPTFETAMLGEVARCQKAVELSREGKRVCVVCSGDASLYGMASLLVELSDENDEIEVIPGVTAAVSASALLGAPLSGDVALISLSDLLTPWELITRRLQGATLGDFCIALYNPSSKKRKDYLARAAKILLDAGHPDSPCGIVRHIGREGEQTELCTLSDLLTAEVDMFTTVIIGNSITMAKEGRLVTPRGYRK